MSLPFFRSNNTAIKFYNPFDTEEEEEEEEEEGPIEFHIPDTEEEVETLIKCLEKKAPSTSKVMIWTNNTNNDLNVLFTRLFSFLPLETVELETDRIYLTFKPASTREINISEESNEDENSAHTAKLSVE